VTVIGDGCVDPGALVDLLEQPPAGVYRLKGTVAVRYRARVRHYVVNVVGTSIHVMTAPPRSRGNNLVAIGTHLDVDDVRRRLELALTASDEQSAVGVRRLQRYRQLSI
jgi:G3E family GTPase